MRDEIGQHWILLRGLTRELAHWGDFIPLLARAFPNSRITLLDLPGAGRHYRDITPAAVNGIADRVRAEALKQGSLARPATILALSLGGMVAWEWMRRYPNDICGAVLINISFAGLSPFYQRLRWQSYGKFATLIMKRGIKNREAEILRLVSNRRDRFDETAEQWIMIQKRRPVSLNNACRQIIAAAGYNPGEQKPRQPVLLLNSLGDRLVSPACSEAIHLKWDIALQTHPWAGHDLTLDAGPWVVEQIAALLAESGDAE
ncbi:MAG: alpha/beta fold hydrolase [Gammaproteobacteria bacterium]